MEPPEARLRAFGGAIRGDAEPGLRRLIFTEMMSRIALRSIRATILRLMLASATIILEPPMQKTFLVCHGAWSAGWAWKKMHPLMQAAGHRLVTPTYTGLGERAHLANPSIDLNTHIQDILNVIRYEDLRDIVLIGHSYGGMVATGVADRARDRVSQLIYLDAFEPNHGQSLLELYAPARQRMRDAAKAGDGWRLPPNPTPPDTAPQDVAWLSERRVDQPIKTFETPLELHGGALTLPRSYIYALRISPADPFRPFAERAKTEPGWRAYDIDASHSPHVTAPETLFSLLQTIVSA
jgi:pimeloyl-ACP methyl ester carboxylesterase